MIRELYEMDNDHVPFCIVIHTITTAILVGILFLLSYIMSFYTKHGEYAELCGTIGWTGLLLCTPIFLFMFVRTLMLYTSLVLNLINYKEILFKRLRIESILTLAIIEAIIIIVLYFWLK